MQLDTWNELEETFGSSNNPSLPSQSLTRT